jgi:ankyrin repeat protein
MNLLEVTDPEDFKRLMNEGANVNIQDKDGQTPLHYACGHEPSVAEFLVKHGADVNTLNNDGWTPLHLACLGNRTSIVRILVEAGADVNVQTCRGDTPLHLSCYRNPECMEYLIAYGADVNIRTKSGNTMIQTGCEMKACDTTMRLLYIHSTEFPVGHRHPALRALVALYSTMIWKRSKVGGLPSHVMVQYLV